MQVPFVQVDAFADALFEGNPAAVLRLPHWLPDAVLQHVASENNLSETAFTVAEVPGAAAGDDPACPAYHLRWFTPTVEVDLCGHATLATACHLFEDVHPDATRLRLWSRSGWLHVERVGEREYTLDFPSLSLTPTAADPVLTDALGVPVLEVLEGMDLVCVVADADTVRAVRPDLDALGALDTRGIVVTADGSGTPWDFVSRFFGAAAGIGEDPVTGSAHSQIAPMWAERLGRTALTGRQLSLRGGTVRCEVAGTRTLLTGRCERYLRGTVTLPDAPAGTA